MIPDVYRQRSSLQTRAPIDHESQIFTYVKEGVGPGRHTRIEQGLWHTSLEFRSMGDALALDFSNHQFLFEAEALGRGTAPAYKEEFFPIATPYWTATSLCGNLPLPARFRKGLHVDLIPFGLVRGIR